jgi:hypothetical protein
MSFNTRLHTFMVELVSASAILATTGCYTITKEFPISEGKSSQYLECLRTPGGICKQGKPEPGQPEFKKDSFHALVSMRPFRTFAEDLPAAIKNELSTRGHETALKVWNHPVHKKIKDLYHYLGKGQSENVKSLVDGTGKQVGQVYTLELTAEELLDYQSAVQASIGTGAWDALADVSGEHYRNMKSSKGIAADESKAAEEIYLISVYVSEYIRAYFRNGEFVKLSLDTTNVQAALKKEIEARFPGLDDQTQKDLIKNLFDKFLGDGTFFGEIGTVGFVTRSGATYQFPSLESRLDPLAKRPITVSKVDFPGVASDLVRVVLEGTFDALFRLPAVSNATGARLEALPTNLRLPIHDPDPTKSPVNEKKFGNVNQIAGQVEAAASTAFGQFIRGAGWASLNNEAVAKSLETLVGVTLRKVMEQCVWCWYACQLDQQGVTSGSKVVLKVAVKGSWNLR